MNQNSWLGRWLRRKFAPTRRFFFTGTALTAPSSALALSFLRSKGGAGPVPQTITGISPTSATVLIGSTTGTVVTTISTIVSPSSPAFTGTYVLAGTDAAKFQVVGTGDTAQLQIAAPGSPISSGPYNITLAPTQAGLIGSGTPFAMTITGVTSGLTVNGFTATSAVTGDSVWVRATGVPVGHGITIKLCNPGDPDNSGGIQSISLPSSPQSTLDFVIPLTGNTPPLGYLPLTPGTYQMRMLFDGSLPIISRVTVTVTALYLPFQPNPNIVNGFPSYHFTVTPTLSSHLSQFALAVSGTVTISGDWVFNFAAAPQNVTFQLTLNDQPLGSPIFAPTGVLTTTFDTTTKPDGTYVLGCRFVDCADVFNPVTGGKFFAYQLMPFPISLAILNGTQPPPSGHYPDPAGTYSIPIFYVGAQNRICQPRIDFLTYSGLPQPGAPDPYFIETGTILPTYNSSSQYFSNPAGLRVDQAEPHIYWFGCNTEPRYYEYIQSFQFWTAAHGVGGIFSGNWIAHVLGDQSVEMSYPVAGSFLDGGRNSNMTSNYVTYMQMPQAGSLYSGPFPFPANYFWSGVQEDGRVTAITLAGDMITIAGPKRDTSQLPWDWTDPTAGEIPNSVYVGTLDTSVLYSGNGSLTDIGGAALDICWDPRDPFVCYTCSPVDHCINKINFHSQVIGGVTYGPFTTFVGTISGGTTLTVAGITNVVLGPGYQIQTGAHPGTKITAQTGGATGGNGAYTISPSQPNVTSVTMTAFNPLLQLYAGYKGGIPSTGLGGFHDGPALDPFTGGVPGSGYAQFSGPYSICQVKKNYGGSYPYPIGTMFVADNYNGLIRIISAQSLDGNGNQAVVSTVTTLIGLQGNSTPPYSSPSNAPTHFQDNTLVNNVTYTVDAITLDGGGTTATLAIHTPTIITGVGWKFTLLVNGSPYSLGGTMDHQYGIFTLVTFTSSQNFQIAITSVPVIGPDVVTILVSPSDIYSSPTPVTFAAAATVYPQVVRMASEGSLVLGEAWYNQMMRRIWLTPGQPNTGKITRIGAFGNFHEMAGTAFGWSDVDDADGDPTAVSLGIGACGPIDDIVCFKTDSNPGNANTIWRMSLDGMYSSGFYGGPGNFYILGQNLPIEGQAGGGHYPWAFSFGKTQCRMISNGLSDTGPYFWRPFVGSSDPDPSIVDPVMTALDGGEFYYAGCPTYFPINMRPSFSAQMGPSGMTHFGQNVAPNVDDLQSMTDSQIITFIQAGGAGTVPRPEFSIDDDHLANPTTVLGRDLQSILYYLRRSSLQGSWPTNTPNVFDPATSTNGGAAWLLPSASWDLDYIRPNITITSAARVSNTSITVGWNTDKNTIGIIIASSPFSQEPNESFLGSGIANYNVWTLPVAPYKMTGHSHTITGLPDITVSGSSPTHFRVFVKDKAGNWNVTADQTLS